MKRIGLWLVLAIHVGFQLGGCVSTQSTSTTGTPVISPAPSESRQPRALTPPAEFAASIEFARTMGALIYRHHRARQIAITHLQHSATRQKDHWITEQVDGVGTVQVSLVESTATTPTESRITNSLLVRDTHTQLPLRSLATTLPRRLTDFESAKLRATNVAMTINAENSAANIDAVVISWRRSGADVFYAYILPTMQKLTPCAEAREVIIDSDGTKVLALRSLTSTCEQSEPSSHLEPIHMAATRDTPSPIDVFSSLYFAQPIHLRTTRNDMLWRIDGDQISLVNSDRM